MQPFLPDVHCNNKTAMKKLGLLLLLLLPMTSFGQSNGTWSVSTHFQSEHNFVPMMRNDIMHLHYIEPMWQKRFHYTTGLGINYRFKNQLEISSGIRYSRKKEELNGYYYFCGTVDYIAAAPRTRHYIEMPVMARYYILPGKFKLHVETGWIGSYRMDNQQYSDKQSWMLSPQSGIGVNLFLNRWQFGLGANYRLQFDFGERTPFYSVNPHAFGIEFKTAFSLNN